jgi:CHAT domain-containing protein/tetratricopeptide (TPR) repeat protein
MQVRQQRPLSEVDLWVPLLIASHDQDIDDAGLAIDVSLELAEQLGRQDVLLQAAGQAFYLAQFRVPLDHLTTAVEKWVTLPTGPRDMVAAAYLNQQHGNILFQSGRYREALSAYHNARRLYRTATPPNGLGNTLLGEAKVLFLLGENNSSLHAYRQARSIFTEFDDKIGQGSSWHGEAEVRLRIGQIDSALNAYRQARSLFVAANYNLGQGGASLGEAQVLFRLGVNGGALNAYRQARALFTAIGDKIGLGNSWLGEAQVLFRLDQSDSALHAYRQARSIFGAVSNKGGQGNAWLGEADVLFRLGQYDSALDAYRQARSLYVAVGEINSQGNAWLAEADVLFHLGENDNALKAYRHARSLYVTVGDKLGQANAWQGESEVLLRQNELTPAHRAAENAVQLAENVGAIPNELSARIHEARILLAGGQEHRSIQLAEDALKLLRRWRQQGISDLDRTAMANWSGPYSLLIPLLAGKYGFSTEKALALVEEAHAPVLLDLLVTGSRPISDIDNLELLKESKRLQHERAELDRRLHGTITSGARQKLQRERAEVDVRLELNELAALASLDSPMVNGEPIDTKARDALVRTAGPILLYYVADDETVTFFLQPGQRAPLVRRIGLSKGQLEDEVRALRHDLANPLWKARAHARQRALFQQLVAPFGDALAATPRLTIIPHGSLHELPFEALLVDDSTPLFERWHVTIAPSLSALHAVRQRRAKRKPAPNDIPFVGIAGGTGLSLSGPAIEDVGAGFGAAARLILPGPGSHPAYLAHAPRARHLLMATHGTHVAHSRSGHLELTAPEGHATRLTANEIAQNPLRAELVTLAACETARGEAMRSDERLDLTRAFLIAGAGAVLATRWRVPATEETRLFLIDFYQALRQGGPGGTPMHKDEALTEARRRSRERGDDAQLWAAWVLVGDTR